MTLVRCIVAAADGARSGCCLCLGHSRRCLVSPGPPTYTGAHMVSFYDPLCDRWSPLRVLLQVFIRVKSRPLIFSDAVGSQRCGCALLGSASRREYDCQLDASRLQWKCCSYAALHASSRQFGSVTFWIVQSTGKGVCFFFGLLICWIPAPQSSFYGTVRWLISGECTCGYKFVIENKTKAKTERNFDTFTYTYICTDKVIDLSPSV